MPGIGLGISKVIKGSGLNPPEPVDGITFEGDTELITFEGDTEYIKFETIE